jgi:predicted nucleic acid-binding protein
MATMAADPVFIDTNVLIYATCRTASEHATAQAALAPWKAKAADCGSAFRSCARTWPR